MWRLIAFFLATLAFILPLATATNGAVQHGITDWLGLQASNLFYHAKMLFFGLQKWTFAYIIHDTSAVDNINSAMERERAFNSLFNDEYNDPSCCKSASCYINQDALCTTLCVECGQAEQELNQHQW